MTLLEFSNKFVEPNTIVRLWYKNPNGHTLVHGTIDGDCIAMNWQINPTEWYAGQQGDWIKEYANSKVIGVTDILSDYYPEAVNIVIEGDGDEE